MKQLMGVTGRKWGGWAWVGQGLDEKAASALSHQAQGLGGVRKGLLGGTRCSGKTGGGQRETKSSAGLYPLGTSLVGSGFLQTQCAVAACSSFPILHCTGSRSDVPATLVTP